MAQAAHTNTTRFPIAASREAEVIDMETGEIITAAQAHRRALLRAEWSAYGLNGEKA
jgi:hypothetical protein